MEQQDFLNEMEEKKLPSMLNVLTILTFIACAMGIIGDVYTFLTAESGVREMEKAMSDPNFQKAPEFVRNMMTPEMLEMKKTMAANKLPIVILNMLGFGLCLAGAIQMRNRKMQGYYLWLIGEILPIITSFIFIGTILFSGWKLAFIAFPIIFIILYTTQRKHLTK